jgi:hypothetical protein
MQSVQNKESIELLTHRYAQKLDIAIHRKQENDTQSAKDCIELAEILEEIYAQQGKADFIGEICGKITHDYKERGVTNASHVSDYLPAKYKRDYDNTGREYSHGANILDNNLLSLQQVDLKQLQPDIKQKAFEILTKFTDNIEKDAQEEHYGLFKLNNNDFDNFKTQDAPRAIISTPKDDPKETELSDAIQLVIDALGELKRDFIEYPPAWKTEAKIFSQGWLRFAKIIRWLTDDKFSLHPMEWFNRENYRQFQGKHASAVIDKADTVLCINCSKNLDNDPEDYEIMYADYRSHSGWRCIKCRGTVGIP